MSSRTIAIRITVESASATKAVQENADAVKDLGLAQQKLSQLQEGLTNSFIKGNLAARAISVGYNLVKNSISEVVQSAIELEFTMAKISAISGEGEISVGSLRDTVQSLALESSKSAVDIAKAALEMNKIGLSNPQVRLLLGSVVELSTALDEDLVKSGETVVNILNAYGDSVLDGKKRTEELAFTVGASALTMDTFGTAFAYVGATAKLAGVKFEDLTAAMDVLSNSGIRASTIGTQLRRIIADLSNENSKASKALGGTIESLGGLIPALDKLRQATPKGDEGVAFLTEKFGRQASSVAAILALNTEEIKRLSAETEGANGSLDRMQGIMNDTFTAKWAHFLNVIKELGGAPMFLLKSGLDLVNNILDGTVSTLDKVNKGFDAFLRHAETQKSVKAGGGFGDLLVADQKNLKEQIQLTDALVKKQGELGGKAQAPSVKTKPDYVSPAFGRVLAQEFSDNNFTKDVADRRDDMTEGFKKEKIKPFHTENVEQSNETKEAFKAVDALILKSKSDVQLYFDTLKVGFDTTNHELEATKFGFNLLGNSVDLLAQDLSKAMFFEKDPFKGFGDSFKKLAEGFVAQLISMELRILAFKAAMSIFGLFAAPATGGASLAGEAAIGSLASTAASGTDRIVTKPTLFMAGESGKERVQVTPRAKMSSGGGGITVNIQGDVMDGAKFTEAVEMANKKLRGRNV